MAQSIEMRVAWGDTMLELTKTHLNLMILDGDLGNSTMAQTVAYNAPDFYMNMGIAEQNMMGVAAGMASVGIIPWLSSFACFLANRDLDQLRVTVAQPHLNVKLAGHYSGILAGKTGKTHIDVGDIAVMRALPHMVVVAPADAVECRQAAIALTDMQGPAYLRIVRDAIPTVFGEDYKFVLGKVVPLREGKDVTIFGTGAQSVRALEACDLLAAEGISAHLVHVPTLKPIDVDGIVAAAKKTGRVLTTEDHNIIGGLGGAVAEVLGQHHPVLMKIHGLQDCYGESGPNDAMLEKYGLTPK
ncbi:MAG TPA: transketolase C-terminal domain-containing protein, partial [Candidatus Methylomirabilis sp.]|nr:transketolase C-terminal domain-containing protein [Candidatus Methylomirabilis sp.]